MNSLMYKTQLYRYVLSFRSFTWGNLKSNGKIPFRPFGDPAINLDKSKRMDFSSMNSDKVVKYHSEQGKLENVIEMVNVKTENNRESLPNMQNKDKPSGSQRFLLTLCQRHHLDQVLFICIDCFILCVLLCAGVRTFM